MYNQNTMFSADKVQPRVRNLLWQNATKLKNNLSVHRKTANTQESKFLQCLIDASTFQPSLTDPVAETLIHVFITSHMDFCCVVLFWTEFQYVENFSSHSHEALAAHDPHPQTPTLVSGLGTASPTNLCSSPLNFSTPLTLQRPFGTSSTNMTRRRTRGLWTWGSSPSQHQQAKLLGMRPLPSGAPQGDSLCSQWTRGFLAATLFALRLSVCLFPRGKAPTKHKLLSLFILLSQRSDVRDEPCFTQTRPAPMWHRAHRHRGLVINT